MNHGHRRIRDLFLGYLEGRLSASDQLEFWGYLDDPAFEQIIKQLLSERFDQEKVPVRLKEAKQQQVLAHIFGHRDSAATIKLGSRLRWFPNVAAMLIAAMAITFIIYSVTERGITYEDRVAAIASDIPPGTHKATLALADGRVIDLSESESGIVMKDDNIKYDGGSREIVDLPANIVQQLVLITPKGGTYQLTLPDGSRVWLNAGSTLKYPSGFDDRERFVELEGEAFFDVRKSTVPFRVRSADQTVEVLGTSFNLSAYSDEPATLTTLVEGSVQIVDSQTETANKLQPGQQSTLQGGVVDIKTVDVGRYIAWKEGLFHFQNTAFEEMMRQISRWYDVDIRYTTTAPQFTFTGKMSRNLSLMTVLELLNVSNVHVRLEDKQLIID